MGLNLYGSGMVVSKLLFPKLVKEFTKLKENKKLTSKIVARSGLYKIILDELGIHCNPVMENNLTENSYVSMPLLNEDHPFFQRHNTEVASAKSLTMAKRLGKDLIGGFDKNGKAFGFITEIDHCLSIGGGLITAKYTAEEIAAIVCHELGHLRTFYKNLVYSFTANSLITAAVEQYMNAPSKEEAVKLITDYEEVTESIIQDKATLGKDPAKVTCVFVGALKNSNVSELNCPTLDATQAELEADLFAMQAGVQDHLGKALSKVHGYFNIDRIPRPIYYFFHTAGFLAKLSIGLANPIIGGIMIAGLMFDGSPLARDYDKGSVRITRMRKALLSQSKNPGLNKEERKSLGNALVELDNLANTYKDKTTILEFLWTKTTPWGRKDKKQHNLIKTYESLVNNELHGATNALKAI